MMKGVLVESNRVSATGTSPRDKEHLEVPGSKLGSWNMPEKKPLTTVINILWWFLNKNNRGKLVFLYKIRNKNISAHGQQNEKFPKVSLGCYSYDYK